MESSDFNPVPEEFKPAVDEDRIATYILSTNLDTQLEIADLLGLKKATVNRYLREASDAGILDNPEHGEYRATRDLLELLSSFHDGTEVKPPSEHQFDSINPENDWKPLIVRLENQEAQEDKADQNQVVEERILETISEEGGRIGSVRAVADKVEISYCYASKKISEMEEQGILEKHENGRSKQITILSSDKIDKEALSRREQIINFIQVREGEVESLKKISDETCLTPERISQIISELEDDGVVETSKIGRRKTVRIREKVESNAESYVEYDGEFENYIQASEEIFGYRLEGKEELSFSDIMLHLSGEREIVEHEIRQKTEFWSERYGPEIFRTLNSKLSLKILKEFRNYDSFVEMRDDLGIGEERLKEGIRKLGEEQILDVDETKYSIEFAKGELYDDARKIIRAAHILSEYESSDNENTQGPEPTEIDVLEENREINRWIANLDLVGELTEEDDKPVIESETPENPGNQGEQDAEGLENFSGKESERYQKVVECLEENEGYLNLSEIAQSTGMDEETTHQLINQGQREGEIIGISKNGNFEVYLPEVYRDSREVEINSDGKEDINGAVYGKSGKNGQIPDLTSELGEEIDPDELGHSSMDGRQYDERYREIWVPRLKQKTGSGSTFTYNELADQTNWAPDQVRKTVAWMAYRGMAEVYENGVKIVQR